MNIFLEQMAASQSPYWNHGKAQPSANPSQLGKKIHETPFSGFMQDAPKASPKPTSPLIRPNTPSWQEDLRSNWERPSYSEGQTKPPAKKSSVQQTEAQPDQNSQAEQHNLHDRSQKEGSSSPKATASSSSTAAENQNSESTSTSEAVNPSIPPDQAVTASVNEGGTFQTASSEEEEEPILLLLTGQLQHLPPQTLPQLVLNNEFIESSMAAPSPEAFLKQTQTAGAWLQQLGLSPEKQLALLEQNALTAEQNITGMQLFRELGFDTEVVLQELGRLHDKLPTEGLTPLMVRAAAMQKQQKGNEEGELSPLMVKPESKLISEEASQTGPRLAKQDPFQMMAQSWDAQNVEHIDLSQQQRPEWLNQLQDSLLMSETNPGLSSIDTTFSEQSPMIPIEAVTLDGQTEFTQLWQPPQEIHHQEVTLLQLGEDGLSPIEDGMFSSDQGDFSRSGSQDFEFAQTLGTTAAKLHTTESAAKAWEMELQNPQIQRIRQDIISRADMLIKEGGGSIKIDLGHEELGKIDLAIEIKDQKIDMRIIAGTEKARELLAQELPRLREALQAHELDLQSVDIGLRQESSWSQSFEDGSQRQGEAWQEEGFEGPWQVSKQVKRERSWAPQSTRIQHNGHIQVRV